MKTPASLLLLSALAALPLSTHLTADSALGDKLGTVAFEVSGTAQTREHVVRGVKLLHHMMYPEADREFVAAAEMDPACSLAYWGRAMTLLHPLWPDVPSAADLKQGAALLQQGLACPPATPRERAYLETLAVYFDNATPEQHSQRLAALAQAAQAQAAAFPEDLDAAAFSALFHLAPARFLPKDKSHRLQLEAASVLQQVLAKLPDHPGAQHYKIHAYDFPLLADRALEVCDTYGRITPDVPHALHMPTHIYTRRGLWEKSIEFNRRSAEAARKLGESAGAINGHQLHALDYMTYAHLQRGQFREAERVRDELLALRGPYSPVQPGAMAFAFSATPARCVLEQQRWADAAALPLRQPATFQWGDAYRHCDSIVHFTRAVGAARSGQLEQARAEIAQLEQLGKQLSASKTATYWKAQAETQRLTARAWVLQAEGKTDEAIALLQRAVTVENGTDKEAVTPGEVLPAGDLLGDLLLDAGRPTEALAAYEAVHAASPNRFYTLFGAGLAAERAGDAEKAARYYGLLREVASAADANVPRLEHARSYLAHAVAASGLAGTAGIAEN